MKKAVEEERAEYRPAGISLFGLSRCCWQARTRGMREAAAIVVCALVTVLSLCLYERGVVPAFGGMVVTPTSTPTMLSDELQIDAQPETDCRREHVPSALNLNKEN